MEGDRGSKMGGGGARAQAAQAFMQLKFLGKGEKKRLDAARAVWPVRFTKLCVLGVKYSKRTPAR